MNKRVVICMSTYNGIKFIDDQINSILKQSFKNFNLIIRDDGSTDEMFISKLKEYNSIHSNITVHFEENVGVTESFYRLLYKCPKDSDYIFLADQDDVWHEQRIENTLNFLQNHSTNTPLLSSCRLKYVDENLSYLSEPGTFKHFGFSNAMVQNLATGCTICINNAALHMFLLYKPRHSVIHDWWLYLLISGTGIVIQEPHISIQYRQHQYNVLGGTASFVKKFKRRFKNRLISFIFLIYPQIQEFAEHYSTYISHSKKKQINQFLKTKKNIIQKFLFLFNLNLVRREKYYDNIILRIIVLFTRIK